MFALLSACSPTRILNALAPREGVAITRDIAYGTGARHGLDIYAPTRSAGASPVLIFIYGGNWDSGSKAMYRFVGATLAAHGVLTVIPDYRLYPEVRFPEFMYDAAAALAWTRDHIAEFGGDPRRLFVMGHSAGAQVATLLALDPTYLQRTDVPPSVVCGVIGLAGPYDFLPLHDPEYMAIFGPEAERPRSQPINYVTSKAPPMLLLAGRDDKVVDPGNTQRLAARLTAAGTGVRSTLYPGAGHAALIGAMAPVLRFLAPVRTDVLGFVDSIGACGP